MDPQSRNFRDFLIQYNMTAENCFLHCVNEMSSPYLTKDEMSCADQCAYKHVKMNQRAMQVFVEVQPVMTQKKVEEAQKQAAELEAKAEAEKLKQVAEISPADSGAVASEIDSGEIKT